jgi:FAD dependent monooxygenase
LPHFIDTYASFFIRFGYSVAFLARTEFLRIAYESYPEKTKVITGKRVTEVKHCQGGICAVTDDGSVYQGSLVVGADGVHSRIRSEMWRMANKDELESISDKEKKSQYPEHRCL